MPRRLVVLGAGGLAREVSWYAVAAGFDDLVFVDETVPSDFRLNCGGKSYRVVNNCTEFGRDEDLTDFCEFVAAVASPAVRRKLVSLAALQGLRPAATLVHAHAHIYGDDCSIGRGGVVAPGCRLTTNITIGDFVVLGINSTIGHDAVLGDFVTCNPGCHVSGNVIVGAGTLLGSGSFIKERVVIADNVIVGAQACVVKDVLHPATVVGVPAMPVNRNPT